MQQFSRKRFSLSAARRQREGGYLLLAILLMMAFMVITLAYVVGPNMVTQIKRDREEEMIHRGTEYMRAIKKFYKKNGRYPASLDDLDKGQIHYLRQRYKDPLSKDGKWKLLTYTDIATVLNPSGPGVPAGQLNQQAGGGTFTPGGALIQGVQSPAGGNSPFGALGSGSPVSPQVQQQFQNPGLVTGSPVSSGFGGSISTPNSGSASSSSENGQQSGSSGDQSSSGNTGGNQSSSPFGSTSAGGNSIFGSNSSGSTQFGGGAIVGVASTSKEKTIRIYNKKKTYNEWQFIYNPVMDRQNVLLRGPYQPTQIGNTNIGTPASQLNGQQGANGQQNSPFGQQNNGFGQGSGFGGQSSGSGFGQQNTPQSYQPLGGSSGQSPQ